MFSLFKPSLSLRANSSVANPLSVIANIPLWLVWLSLVGFLLICAVLYVQIPVNPDSAVFDYIGWVVSEGGAMYVDAADQNWPGQMLIHTLSATVFGNHLWSYRALEVLVILPLSCWVLFAFVQCAYGRTAAILVIPVFWFFYMTSGYWLTGQRDMVASPLLIAAVLMMYRRITLDNAMWVLVLQGACIALATLIRPTLLIAGPLLMLADVLLVTHSQRGLLKVLVDHTIVGASILCVLGLIACLAIPSGALAAWFETSIRFPLEVYSQSKTVWQTLVEITPYIIRQWFFFIPVILVGGYYLRKINIIAFGLSVVILPVGLISILVQGKALGYHLAVWHSLIAIWVAVAIAKVLPYIKEKQLPLMRMILICLLMITTSIGILANARKTFAAPLAKNLGVITNASFYGRYDAGDTTSIQDMLMLSDYVKRTTSDSDTVLIWSRSCHVNTLSGRRSPFFAISSAIFLEPTPAFSGFERWYQRLQSAFENKPPALLMLVKQPEGRSYVGLPKEGSEPRLGDIVVDALTDYRLETTIGNVDVFRHRDHTL